MQPAAVQLEWSPVVALREATQVRVLRVGVAFAVRFPLGPAGVLGVEEPAEGC